MISNTGQVADPPTTNNNGAVLLEVVVDAGNVGCDFLAVCEPDTGDLPQSGVWFFGRLSPHNEADAPFLGRTTDIGDSFSTLRFCSWTSD